MILKLILMNLKQFLSNSQMILKQILMTLKWFL